MTTPMNWVGIFKKLRFVSFISSLLGVVFLIFFLFQILGDPTKMIVGQSANKKSLENIRKDMNLDQPVWTRFIYYVNDVSPLSFYNKQTIERKEIKGIIIGDQNCFVIKWPYLGRSYQSKQWVSGLLMQALFATSLLAFAAMFFAILIGIPLGVYASVYKGRMVDTFIQVLGVIGTSAPSFFIGLMVAFLGGMVFQKFTGLNFNGSLYEVDPTSGEKIVAIKNIILPSLALALRPLSMIMQMTRSSMLDVLNQDYIRTSKAKGLSNKSVLFKHALRNALNPILTGITGWTAELLAGAFFIEFIFGWQGIGKLTVDALEKLDWPVLNGAILLSAIIFIATQSLTDWLQRILDPRIK
jgi:peptide/nickel transport system permease protein